MHQKPQLGRLILAVNISAVKGKTVNKGVSVLDVVFRSSESYSPWMENSKVSCVVLVILV